MLVHAADEAGGPVLPHIVLGAEHGVGVVAPVAGALEAMPNDFLQRLLLGLLDHGLLGLDVRVGGQAGLREELADLNLRQPDRRAGLLQQGERGEPASHPRGATLQHAREQRNAGAGGRCVQVVVGAGPVPDQRPTSQPANTAFAGE